MAIMSRRMSMSLIAAAALAVLSAAPSLAQVSPGGARVGPAGGTPSTTAPSNSEGTPAGGTGVVGQTQVGGGYQAGTAGTYTPQRRVRRARTARNSRRAARRTAMRRSAPAASSQGGVTDTLSNGAYNGGTGASSSSGLNGSNRQSDVPR